MDNLSKKKLKVVSEVLNITEILNNDFLDKEQLQNGFFDLVTGKTGNSPTEIKKAINTSLKIYDLDFELRTDVVSLVSKLDLLNNENSSVKTQINTLIQLFQNLL